MIREKGENIQDHVDEEISELDNLLFAIDNVVTTYKKSGIQIEAIDNLEVSLNRFNTHRNKVNNINIDWNVHSWRNEC